MPKEKVKINLKERLDENVLDLSLSGMLEMVEQEIYVLINFATSIL